jgi:transaldolase
MKYFLDSAKLNEIDYAYENYGIDGVTTNPRHIMMSGKPFLTAINDISNWVKEKKLEGYETFPISVEINPHLSTWQEMVEEGKKIAALSTNFVIKIPCIEQGLIAARKLEQSGIRTNVTLVFSTSQAIPAGRLNAKFVSPFVGWKESSGEDTAAFIQDIVDIYDIHNFSTEIIVAALRNGKQIADAAKMGAHIVTCGLDVYQASFEHPFTTYGLGVFRKAWDETAKQ